MSTSVQNCTVTGALYWQTYTNCPDLLSDMTQIRHNRSALKGGYKLVTLPRIVTPYRDSVDVTRDLVTYQKSRCTSTPAQTVTVTSL